MAIASATALASSQSSPATTHATDGEPLTGPPAPPPPEDVPTLGAPGARPPRRRPVHLVSTAVGVVGAIVVASLVWLTGVVNSHTQTHLLQIQTAAAGIVIGEVIPSISEPLNSALAVAEQSRGHAIDVAPYVEGEVGTKPGQLFTSLSLWRITPSGPVRLLHLGERTALSNDPAALAPIFARIPGPEKLSVVDLLHRTPQRIGYAVESLGATPRYAIFADSPIPVNHRAVVPASSAFHDLNFALYLGSRPMARNLLEATTPPPNPPTSSVSTPFGTSSLDFVASARSPLGGGVLPALPWMIGAVGAVLVAAAVVMTEWLMRRRRTAEHLARENLRLYAEQRSISESLQNALLPKRLPLMPGIDFAARYVPGDSSAEIGGDWYDVIRCDDRSFIFAIGDVSGRGIAAANTMASLHYAIRAYAAQGDDAGTILEKLTALLDVSRDGHFATVLVGHVDVPDHLVTVVNAGHPPPLVVSNGRAEFIQAAPGAPIGVSQTVPYVPSTAHIPAGASVLAYTDGLVERRGEYLDVGLDRLQEAASTAPLPPDGLLERVVSKLAREAAADDIALLAMRWTE
jgi:hypothetical protein